MKSASTRSGTEKSWKIGSSTADERCECEKETTMKINPYLNFNGNCSEAFQFYAKALGGKDLRIMTFRDSPMGADMPANEKDWVMHARFTLGNFKIMGSDSP